MKISNLLERIKTLHGSLVEKPKIIVEKDTSLTFDYHGHEWNLPNSIVSLRHYQLEFHRLLLHSDTRFFYLAWPRRAGKEVTTWTGLLKYAFMNRCTAAFIYPNQKMASRILWDGDFSCGGSVRKFLDFLPECVDRERDVNNTIKRIKLPNGSTIWVLGTVNPEALRGINPKIVCLSEYAFGDHLAYEAIRPILAENGGKLILQTTFNGKNFAYDHWMNVQNMPQWYTSFFTVDTLVDEQGKRYVSEAELDLMRREGYPEFKIRQEFYMDTSGDENKFYFAPLMKHLRDSNRIKEGLLKPFIPVFTFWDIGHAANGDANFIIVVQFSSNQPNIVACFESHGKTWQAEIEMITEWRRRHQLPLGKHFLPHDGKNTSKSIMLPAGGGEAGNPVDLIKEVMGEPCEAVNKPVSEVYGLNLMRSILPFCMIDISCSKVIECLDNHAKKYDDVRQVYLMETRHDKYSHGIKALQTMCIAITDKQISNDIYTPGKYIEEYGL